MQTYIHTCAFASAWDVCWWWYMPRFTVSARTTLHNGKKWDLKESCLFATSNFKILISTQHPGVTRASSSKILRMKYHPIIMKCQKNRVFWDFWCSKKPAKTVFQKIGQKTQNSVHVPDLGHQCLYPN